MKSVLAGVGLIAVVAAAYFIATGKKPEGLSELADGKQQAVAAQTQNGADSAESGKNTRKDPNAPRTPLDWKMEEIREKPIEYFEYCIKHAEKKRAEIKAKESELRLAEKNFSRKSERKKQEAAGLNAMVEKALAAYRAANEKYGETSPNWICQFPTPDKKLKRRQMENLTVRMKKQADSAQKAADRYAGVQMKFQSVITSAEEKGFDLDMALDQLRGNLESVRANTALVDIEFNEEEIMKMVDTSSVFEETDDLDATLKNFGVASGIEAVAHDQFNELMAN